jgi:Flp pilus assembly protein TadG
MKRPGRLLRAIRPCEGSAMVESAIIFPLIILAAMFTVYMTLNYYSECSLRSKLHTELRQRAAKETGNTQLRLTEAAAPDAFRAKAEKAAFKYRKGGGDRSAYLSADATASYTGGMLTIESRIKRSYKARYYIIDEKKGLPQLW